MDIRQMFLNPPAEYSPAPFWFWNDDLKYEHLEMQLKEMHDKGVYEFVVHARKGMQLQYLSAEWFDRIGFVLEKARELGMKAWIYDEDNWPSGYAGGKLIRGNPDFSAKCLSMEKVYPVIEQPLDIKMIDGYKLVGVVAVYKNERFLDLTDYENNSYTRWTAEEYFWEVFVFRQSPGSHKPAYSNEKYVDMLNDRVTEKFIEITHKEYKNRFPEHWGSTIKGFFTDEPGFYNNFIEAGEDINTISWTDGFPEYFKSMKSYNIIEFLPAVWNDWGPVSRKARCDYYEVLAQMYMEKFFKPIHDFCTENGVDFIGHVLIEENLKHIVRMQAHYFQAMRYLTIPGIDKISRGRERITEKLASSAAHIFNRQRAFSETYACSGWDLTLEEMKAVADWQYVQGINMIVPHAFYSSIEGPRVLESPPSEFYQNNYWKYFKKYSDYITRLSYILSQGYHVCSTLVYYPITSCWEKIGPLEHCFVDKIDEVFKELSLGLLKHQMDFDYVDDYAIAERAVIEEEKIRINEESYRIIIIPFISNIPLVTAEFLYEFADKGGIVMSIRGIPFNGSEPGQDKRVKELVENITRSKKYFEFDSIDMDKIFNLYRNLNLLDMELDEKDFNIKYLHRKINDAEDVYFIINEDENEIIHSFQFSCDGLLEEWDTETGAIKLLEYKSRMGKTTVELTMNGYGSRLLVFTKNEYTLHGIWNIQFHEVEVKSELKSWSELGYTNYSGFVTYTKEFIMDREHADEINLDLGMVKDCAEVYINDKFIDTRVWRPYRLNITDEVHRGKNVLKIVMSNTMANRFEGMDVLSGLLGPVKMRFA